MKELLRTTDPTVIAFATALLDGEGIETFAMDVNMSVLEGSIGVLPRPPHWCAPGTISKPPLSLRDNGIEPA